MLKSALIKPQSKFFWSMLSSRLLLAHNKCDIEVSDLPSFNPCCSQLFIDRVSGIEHKSDSLSESYRMLSICLILK